MIVDMNLQAHQFVHCVLFGFIVSYIYCTIFAFVKFFTPSNFILGIVDFSFFIMATIFFYRYLLISNNGVVRAFMILGLGSGSLLFYITLHPLILKLTKKIAEIFKKIFKKTSNILKKCLHFKKFYIIIKRKVVILLNKAR